MSEMKVGYQLYSARQEAEKDLDAVLARLASLGYDGVEFAGFHGHTAEEIGALLRKHHLLAASSHVPLQSFRADMDGTIAYHKAIGCRFIAVPYLDEQTRMGAEGFAQAMADIAEFERRCHNAGITLMYHNHDFEFIKLSGMYALDFLYLALPALQTELDVCWVKYAGENPVAYLGKYAGRAPIVHLKDYVGVKSDRPPYALIGLKDDGPKDDMPFMFKPFGYGCQDAQAVIKAAVGAGAGWVIVEQDESPERPPLDAAEMSIGTVRKYL